jgi:hypothetical protein
VKKDGMSRQICMVVATALLAAVAEVPLDIAGKGFLSNLDFFF